MRPIHSRPVTILKGKRIAIKEAYRAGKGEQSKQYLIDNADKYGLTAQQIESMDSPVLVLERQDFTKQANRDVTVSMSPVEQAKSDAQLLNDDDLLEINIGEQGDINAPSNHKFLSRFAQKLGDEESAAYVGEDNRWNSDLGKRALAAVFQKAYGDKTLTANVFEDVNQDTKRVMSALARASGHIAKLQGYEQGDRGLGPAIAEAANLVRAASKKGQSATEYLTQLDMLDQPSPIAGDVAQLFSVNVTSTKRMGDVLVSLAKQIESENIASQSGSLLDDTTPSLPELINANKDYQNATIEGQEDKQQTAELFGANPSRLEEVSEKNGGRSEPKTGKRAETKNPPGLVSADKITIDQLGKLLGGKAIGAYSKLKKLGYNHIDATNLSARYADHKVKESRKSKTSEVSKPVPTLEPLAEQPESNALDHTLIAMAGKRSPAYLAARDLANTIKNMMVEG